MRKLLGIAFVVGLSCLSQLALARTSATMSQQQQRLQHIGQSISSLREHLSSDQAKQSQVEDKLRTAEMAVDHQAKHYRATLLQLDKVQRKLNEVESQHDKYQRELSQQKAALAAQVRAEYMLGRQQYLKILLNQEDPGRIDRYLMYYYYLMWARQALIKQVKVTFQKVNKTAVQIQKQTQHLETAKALEQRASQQLQQERRERSQVLRELKVSIGSQQEQLQQLLQDKARLQQVVKYLQEHRYYYTAGKEFSSTKGRLPWPVRNGKVIQSFGVPLVHGRMHSSGILIAAPLGTEIHAIYPGKVVFAHWLRGYGLVVIVQHSEVYMTLYAHLESIYAHVGESVQPGTVLATVGNSGGLQDSALYFEITRFGHGIDPKQWLRVR